jgi:outer membrane protein assembly factor BamB
MRWKYRTTRALTILAGVSALALGTGGGAGAAAAPATTPPGPWFQTDYNAAASRANLAETTLTTATLSKVRYLRSITAPPNPPAEGCVANQGMVAPVLSGGSLYVIASGVVSDYDVTTGRLIWRRNPDPTFSTVYRSLAVSKGVVIAGGVGCDSVSDPNGFLVAFDAATGAKLWSSGTTAGGGALSSMVVANGLVVAIGSSEGSGTIVAAHNVTTGAPVWEGDFEACGGNRVIVVRGLVVFTACNGSLTNFLQADSLATGKRVWRRTGNWTVLRGDSPAASGATLYARLGNTVEDLNPQTGATRFSLPGAADVLAVGATQAYATCSNADVCGYSVATGKRLWGTVTLGIPQSAAEAGGVLYMSGGDTVNATTGAVLRTLWVNFSGTTTALAVGNGHIAVVNDPRVADIYGLPGS